MTGLARRLRAALRGLHEHRWHDATVPCDVPDAMHADGCPGGRHPAVRCTVCGRCVDLTYSLDPRQAATS